MEKKNNIKFNNVKPEPLKFADCKFIAMTDRGYLLGYYMTEKEAFDKCIKNINTGERKSMVFRLDTILNADIKIVATKG